MRGIYIIKFSIYPDMYKIGKSKNIDERIAGFRKSEIMLGDVELCYSKEFENHSKAEKDIHELLKEYRCKDNKEFFKGNLEEFIKVIDSLDPENYKIIEKEKRTTQISEHVWSYLDDIREACKQHNTNELFEQRITALEENNELLAEAFHEEVKITGKLVRRILNLEAKIEMLEKRINDIDKYREAYQEYEFKSV